MTYQTNELNQGHEEAGCEVLELQTGIGAIVA